MPNRLIEKIRDYLKKEDQSTNDDLIQYEPLPQIYLDNLNNIDDSNKEKMLQEIADRNGF
tara:strand:- start:157 stop:336 length:180 start_codon:yes stop_codon:yes gene_type:complete